MKNFGHLSVGRNAECLAFEFLVEGLGGLRWVYSVVLINFLTLHVLIRVKKVVDFLK